MLHSDSITALVLDPSDNVATLLADAGAGAAVSLKGVDGEITARQAVQFGHKIARRVLLPGDPVIKYGQEIGNAIVRIEPGDWVHLHNMASARDTDFRKRVQP